MDPDRYEAVLPLFREMEPVVTRGGEPITPVQAMGGLINRIRRFVDADGAPLAHGFFAIGDAHTCTNPLYGRGSSLAVLQAVLVADALAAHPDDRDAAARAYEAASAARVEPWYDVSLLTDLRRGGRAPTAEPPTPAADADATVGAAPRPADAAPHRGVRRPRAVGARRQDDEPAAHAAGGVRRPRGGRAPQPGGGGRAPARPQPARRRCRSPAERSCWPPASLSDSLRGDDRLGLVLSASTTGRPSTSMSTRCRMPVNSKRPR